MTAAAPVIPPARTGVEDPHDPGEQSTGARVPLPSCPSKFRPQHRTVPSGRRIHVCKPPAATAVGVRAPLAVNCCAWPTPMVGFAGVTARASADRKTRVTDFVVLMVTAQDAPEAVSHPLQIPKVDPLAGLAVRATLVPLS